MNAYSPKEYWTQVAEDFAGADAQAFAPVLHPGAPRWFNEWMDRLQASAWQRALRFCDFRDGARALDVGCGTGRWLRRLGQVGLPGVGMDQSAAMLRLAREHATTSPLLVAEVQELPFSDGSFDCVSDVTVIQHIPLPEQFQALEEMVRILRPGGYLILFEVTRGQGPHVFLHTPADWISQVSSAGPRLVCWFGQEFILFDRMFVALMRMLRRLIGYTALNALTVSSAESAGNVVTSGPTRRAYWALRKVSMAFSVWTEFLAERICPDNWATHGVFIFRK